MPENIYDDPAFFEGYSRLPRSQQGLAGAPEWAALQAMLPCVKGLKVLDLGCGFGYFCRWAAQAGAAKVVGVDSSERMLAHARSETRDSGITYRQADLEDLALPPASFDLVFSSLAIHYVADLQRLLGAVRDWLVPEGRFVFSVEHPIYSAPAQPEWQSDASGTRMWPLRSYLAEGKRVTDWIAPGVVKYHRTVATYVNGLLESGFRLLRLKEWGPSEDQVRDHPEWADEVHRPPFLLVSAQALSVDAADSVEGGAG